MIIFCISFLDCVHSFFTFLPKHRDEEPGAPAGTIKFGHCGIEYVVQTSHWEKAGVSFPNIRSCTHCGVSEYISTFPECFNLDNFSVVHCMGVFQLDSGFF